MFNTGRESGEQKVEGPMEPPQVGDKRREPRPLQRQNAISRLTLHKRHRSKRFGLFLCNLNMGRFVVYSVLEIIFVTEKVNL